MAKLGKAYRNRSISQATLITEDLIERFVDFLTDETAFLEEDHITKLLGIMYDWKMVFEKHYHGDRNRTEVETDLAYILNEDLMNLMDDIAPEGCYFGAHEGNDSDFGFWEHADGAEIQLRDFTREDWMNWGGCDGEHPRIGEIRVDTCECDIVADKNGIGIQGYDFESDPHVEFSAMKVCSSQEVAEEIIKDMKSSVASDCLEMMGFQIQ
jgi:hypothetical protein